MHPFSFEWLLPFLQGLGLGVAAMLLHESGHIVTALTLGIKVKRIGLKWKQGVYVVREPGPPNKNLLIALGGPFVNLLLVATSPWFPVFGLANFCYALANMLPIEGSDGFRVASCWQQIRNKDLMI